MHRILSDSRPETSFLVVKQRHPYTERAEVDPCNYDPHGHLLLPREESNEVNEPNNQQNCAPPDTGVQVGENWRVCGRGDQLIETGCGNNNSIQSQQNAYKKPDRNKAGSMHVFVTKK